MSNTCSHKLKSKAIFYQIIVFDSVIPVIIIHITQDLVVRDIFEEEIEKSNNTATNRVAGREQ